MKTGYWHVRTALNDKRKNGKWQKDPSKGNFTINILFAFGLEAEEGHHIKQYPELLI